MPARIEWARNKAKEVLRELGVTCRDQLKDLESLCAGRGVAVRGESLKNFEGVLLRPQRLILYRETIPEEGRKRFTICHELGHWEMHPHLDQLQACTSGDIHAYKNSDEELEASAFGGEFLMPEFLLTTELKFAAPTIATIKKLAGSYGTSITASAVRLAQHSDMPIFVAFSSEGRLRWYQRSKRAEPYFFKAVGSDLDGESIARTCLTTPDDPSDPLKVETSAWFPDDFNKHQFSIYEESVELGDYGVTMSIITVDD